MKIEDAVKSLEKQLNEPDVFIVSHDTKNIIVDTNFVYRVKDIQAIGTWEGFPVRIKRISCW